MPDEENVNSTEEQMKRRSYNDVAREMFGSDYHGDAEGTEEPTEEEDDRHAPLTVDEAYQIRQEKKDEVAVETESEAETTPAVEEEPEGVSEPTLDDDARWSDDDVQTISAFQSEAQRFQADLTQFAQATASVNLDELSKTDAARAQALKTQMKAVEDELRSRYNALASVQESFGSKVQDRAVGQARKKLDGEKAKLARVIPDLDKAGLASYLQEQHGFSKAELNAAHDHRLVVMAEESRRYRELMANKDQTRTIPSIRKRKRAAQSEPSEVARARKRFENTRGMHAALEMIAEQKKAGVQTGFRKRRVK